MADELDAELLALAGDASDEEPAAPRQKEKPSSPASSESSHSRQQQSSSTMGRKGTAKPVKRSRQSKKADVEDGELSSAESHHSLQSASMSESESESQASPPANDDDGPIFPYEKLYYSAKDKDDIMALPEIQREQILSERAQEVDRHNQDLALRRLLASREKEEARKAKKNKRKASAAGLEDGQRKSSRQKTTLGGRKVGETSGAIEAYKRQREQKNKRGEHRRRDSTSKDEGARSKDGAASDEDAEDQSEVEWDDRAKRSPSPPKDDPPAEFRDLQRARVGRSNFAQVCFYPGFDDKISGCFTRVNIGPNRDTGMNEYRLCLIKKFVEGRPYGMEGPNNRPFITNQYAVLAHGKAEREFPFIACSDSPFTEAEFNRYRQTMAVEDCKMHTKSMVAEKVADINRLLNHQFTNEELNEKLRKQGSFDSKNKVFKRIEAERSLSTAKAAGDYAEVERLEGVLSQLSMPKLAFGASLFKPRQDKPSEQERLAEINLRNQKLNYENVRRAQLEEKKATRKTATARAGATNSPVIRAKSQAKTNDEVNGNSGGLKPLDIGGPNDHSRNGSPMTTTDTSSKANTPRGSATPSSAPKKGGASVIRHRNMDDENIANLDLDIDIDI